MTSSVLLVTVAAAVLNAASAQLFPFSSLRSYIDQHHAESVDLPTQAPPPVDAYRYLHETGSSYIEPSGADSEVTERTVIVTPKPKYIPQRLVPEPSVDPNSPHIPSIGIGGNHSPSEPHQLSSILSPIRSVTIEKPSKIPSKNSKYEPILLKESPAKKPQYYEKTIVESRPSLSVTIPLDGYKKDTGGLIDFLVPPKYPSVYETHMKTMVPSTNNLDSDTDLKQTSAIPVKTKKNKKKNKLKIKGDSSSLGSEKRYRVRTRPPKITKNEPIELHASGTEVYLRPPQSYRPPPISSTPHPIEEQIAAETNFGLGGAGGGERVEFQLHGQNGPESYKFGFDTGDGKNRHFRYEEKDNSGKVKGHYGYYDKTGKLQVVNYHADDTGFHTSSS